MVETVSLEDENNQKLNTQHTSMNCSCTTEYDQLHFCFLFSIILYTSHLQGEHQTASQTHSVGGWGGLAGSVGGVPYFLISRGQQLSGERQHKLWGNLQENKCSVRHSISSNSNNIAAWLKNIVSCKSYRKQKRQKKTDSLQQPTAHKTFIVTETQHQTASKIKTKILSNPKKNVEKWCGSNKILSQMTLFNFCSIEYCCVCISRQLFYTAITY